MVSKPENLIEILLKKGCRKSLQVPLDYHKCIVEDLNFQITRFILRGRDREV